MIRILLLHSYFLARDETFLDFGDELEMVPFASLLAHRLRVAELPFDHVDMSHGFWSAMGVKIVQ
jgi:hypothetical protein